MSATDAATDATTDAKVAMRAAMKARRSDLAAPVRAKMSARLAAIGPALLEVQPDLIVSGFLSIGDELDTGPVLAAVHGSGARLCLPVMQGRGKPLLFRSYAPDDDLATVVWGIREPKPDRELLEPDLLLVPLLAFDLSGWRLGYGGGFYDRTIRELRQRKAIRAIGLAFDEQKVDAVPHLDYDEPLDGVLTPSGLIRCR